MAVRKHMETEKKNKGYTLIELVIVVAIFTILLGILSPSLNAIPYFRMRRAAGSVNEALKRTKTEAMNRLVGEMKLEWKENDGYYISYYLDRGKVGGTSHVQQDQPEKIAPANLAVTYTDDQGITYDLRKTDSHALILTYDRASGAFRPIQSQVVTQELILSDLEAGKDVTFYPIRRNQYCQKITVTAGNHSRSVVLNQKAGTCQLVNE